MKKTLKYVCSSCCEKDNGSPCILQMSGVSGIVEPTKCPYGGEYAAEWELSQKAEIADDINKEQ